MTMNGHVPASLAEHPFTCGLRQVGPRIGAMSWLNISTSRVLAGEERGRLLTARIASESGSPSALAHYRLHNGPDASYPIVDDGWLLAEQSDNEPLYDVECFEGIYLEVLAGTITLVLYAKHDSLRERQISYVNQDRSARFDEHLGE